jgi:hypothetical protein
VKSRIWSLVVFFAVIVGSSAWSLNATESLKNLLAKVLHEAHGTLCPAFKRDGKCAINLISVTQNHLQSNEDMLGITYRISFTGPNLKPGEQKLVGETARAKNIQIIEIENQQVTAISYMKTTEGKLGALSPDGFSRLALNPTHKAVANIDGGFLLAGNTITYQLPEFWEKEGLPAANSGQFTIVITATKSMRLALELKDLSEGPLPSLQLNKCQNAVASSVGGPKEFDIPARIPFTITCEITAARRIKSDQPAFKIRLLDIATTQPIMQLAIPFKPRPNYFMFGVTGFLVGGLIAVMVLFLRKNRRLA